MSSRVFYNNPNKDDVLCLSYHYELLCDQKRVGPIKKSILQTCKNQRVLESGTGTGILSILAANAGATRVYAVEKDPCVAAIARINFAKHSCNERIVLVEKDTRNVSLADLDCEKVDVVIAENLSTWQVTEPQIPVMNHITSFLVKKSGIIIPARIYNYLELAHSCYTFEEIVELRMHYFQFSGICGPELLSNRALFCEIDLNRINPTRIHGSLQVRVEKEGILNSLRLTSPLLIHGDITFDSSDSLMPPVVVPLVCDLPVKKNDLVEITVEYITPSRWEDMKCQARIISSGPK